MLSKIKYLVFIIFGGGIALASPVIPQDMQWVVSYRTHSFNTVDGDLGVNDYVLSEDFDGYYIRTRPKDEAQFEKVDFSYDVSKLTKRDINGSACYDEFLRKDGNRFRVKSSCEEYAKLGLIPNYSQPKKEELVSLIDVETANAVFVHIDASSVAADLATVKSGSWSHTSTTSPNRALFVGVSTQDATDADRPVASSTYNGISLTKVRADNNNTFNQTSEVWKVASPSTGTNTVVVNFTGTVSDGTAGAMTFESVDQTTQVDAQNGACTTDNDEYIGVTTITDGAIVFVNLETAEISVGQLSAGSTTSQKWEVDNGSFMGAGGNWFNASNDNVSPQGLIHVGWVAAFSRNYCISGVAVRPFIAALTGNTGNPKTIIKAKTIINGQVIIK